jgi:hypothetical protein
MMRFGKGVRPTAPNKTDVTEAITGVELPRGLPGFNPKASHALEFMGGMAGIRRCGAFSFA